VSKASRFVLAAFGFFVFLLVIYNVEVGLWSHHPEYSQKVDLIGLVTFSCTEAEVLAQLNGTYDSHNVNFGQSPCLHPLGNYALSDILIGGFGGIIGILGLTSALNIRLSSRGGFRRRSWALMIGGLIMTIFGLLDFAGISYAGNGEGVEWQDIFGVPSIFVNALLIFGGVMLFRKGSTDHSKMLVSSQPNRIRYRGKLELDGADLNIGQMRRILGLDILEDVFQLGSSDEFEEKVGRVCHYCSGVGCPECGSSGSI
jgi:hypothetical protein